MNRIRNADCFKKSLKLKFGLDENANAVVVGFYLWNNTLAKASIVSYYKRDKK